MVSCIAVTAVDNVVAASAVAVAGAVAVAVDYPQARYLKTTL
jgi:hypothetical protein